MAKTPRILAYTPEMMPLRIKIGTVSANEILIILSTNPIFLFIIRLDMNYSQSQVKQFVSFGIRIPL